MATVSLVLSARSHHDRPRDFPDAERTFDQPREANEAKGQAVALIVQANEVAGFVQALHDAKRRRLRQVDAVRDLLERQAAMAGTKAFQHSENPMYRAHPVTDFALEVLHVITLARRPSASSLTIMLLQPDRSLRSSYCKLYSRAPIIPPSTLIVDPVINPACIDVRKVTTPTISSCVPMRPSRHHLPRVSACASVYADVPVRCEVSIRAGATQLTVMPCGATSLARCFM